MSNDPVSRRAEMSTRAVLLALALAAPALGDAAVYKVRKMDSTVSFTATKWKVFKEQGRFREFGGTVSIDYEVPSRSKVEIEVATASVDTGVDGRDGAIRSADFLDVLRFPKMTFVSTSVMPRKDGSYDVAGDLTIRGVTRKVTAPLRFLGRHPERHTGELVGFETSFTIDRTQFGVGSQNGEMLIANEVEIRLLVSAAK